MPWRVEHARHRTLLHHPAEIHHHDPVAEAAHHGQVMTDEQQRQAQARAQVGQQGQDLRLNRNIQRRHRLIRDQKLGTRRQRPRDPHPLPLPA